MTAAVRCAPPGNKPTTREMRRCEPYLLRELELLRRVRVVIALGRIAWRAYLRARRLLGRPLPGRAPAFAHGAVVRFADGTTLIGSYHPSQQNTFTGKLTRPMFRRVFTTARRALAGRSDRGRGPDARIRRAAPSRPSRPAPLDGLGHAPRPHS